MFVDLRGYLGYLWDENEEEYSLVAKTGDGEKFGGGE
jgi:hypothetical protein